MPQLCPANQVESNAEQPLEKFHYAPDDLLKREVAAHGVKVYALVQLI